MKKAFISLLTLLISSIGSSAQTFSVAGDVEALSSGETVDFKLHISGAEAMTSTHFEIVLPSGFSVNSVQKTTEWDCMISREGGVVGAISSSDNAFSGEGDIFTIGITVPAETAVGVYPVTINNIRVNGNDIVSTVDFNINVVNVHVVVLDETSTSVPDAAAGVNVLVKRTIKANEWSTICLPFAMTWAQVESAFGEDVQLADFKDYYITEEGDDITGITINFTDAFGIEANHPYIIKVSSAITEFTADGVDIAPDEENAYTVYDNGKTGTKRIIYGWFVGTLHAGETLAENTLFLAENKFWYSAGATVIKGFRAYFDLTDILSEVESSGARIMMDINGEETALSEELRVMSEESSAWYTLNGLRLDKKPTTRGIYIHNGKKVVIK